MIAGICIFLYCTYCTPGRIQYFGVIGQVRREMTNTPASNDPTVTERLAPPNLGRDVTTGQSMVPTASAAKEENTELQEIKKIYPTFHLSNHNQ